MSFLIGLAATIIEWLLSKFGLEVSAWIQNYRAQEAIKEQAAKDAAQLASAKTDQEQKDALSKTINDTFGSGPT